MAETPAGAPSSLGCLCCTGSFSFPRTASEDGDTRRRDFVDVLRGPDAPRRGLVDVHHHIVPPFYLEEYATQIAGGAGRPISAAWRNWTPRQSMEAMDAHGVETAMVSLSTPGVWFGDAAAARRTSRRANEHCAELVRNHPGRFGVFAALPLPDIEGSLREIEYAFDSLGADGICLLSSYDNKWLGDPLFDPVFEELDRRKAVVFVHPTVPACAQNLVPGVSSLMIEAIQDTTRAVTNLLFSGTLTRSKRIRFIFSHAGGSVPMVAARMTLYGPPSLKDTLPEGVDHELRKLYYDIAVSGHRPAIAALASLVPASQILFGSDFPYRQLAETADTLGDIGLAAEDVQALGRDNALALFPRLHARHDT